MSPTLRQLEYAAAVAETLSFRKAAERCSVTQPGLSSQLRELEKALGVRLFERDRRKVLLTPAGERIVAAARRILVEIDDLVDCARSLGDPLAGTLRLGVIPTVAPYLLPRVMPDLHRRYPRLRVLLREEQTERLLELLRSGGLDLLLLALEVSLGDLERAEITRDPFVVALPPDHPLGKRRRLKQEDLRGREVLLLSDGHCLRGQTAPICDAAGACEVADFRATSLGTLVEMVASGVGITLLPAMAVEAGLGSEKALAVKRFAPPEPARTIGIAWRRSSPHRETYRLLAKVLEEILSAPP